MALAGPPAGKRAWAGRGENPRCESGSAIIANTSATVRGHTDTAVLLDLCPPFSGAEGYAPASYRYPSTTSTSIGAGGKCVHPHMTICLEGHD